LLIAIVAMSALQEGDRSFLGVKPYSPDNRRTSLMILSVNHIPLLRSIVMTGATDEYQALLTSRSSCSVVNEKGDT